MHPSQPRLLALVRQAIRRKHYARRTEEAYVGWMKRYIHFHHTRHPRDMGPAEGETFLTHLAVHERVAAATQNQTLAALRFLYERVLTQPLDHSVAAVRAKQPERLPVVLTRAEVRQMLDALTGTHRLMARLLYGSGLRLLECLRLRIKDLDIAQRQITVREGKGQKDRYTLLPTRLLDPLQAHLHRVTLLHE